jgi:hypothetical protein
MKAVIKKTLMEAQHCNTLFSHVPNGVSEQRILLALKPWMVLIS